MEMPFRSPEQEVGRMSGYISSKVNLDTPSKKQGHCVDSKDRRVYSTNATWTMDRHRAQRFLKPMDRTKDPDRISHRQDHKTVSVNQVFYWGHERNSSGPKTNSSPQFPASRIIPNPTIGVPVNDPGDLSGTSSRQWPPRKIHQHHHQYHQKQQKQQHHGISCPTEIYSKFKQQRSGRTNQLVPNVNIEAGPARMQHYTKKRSSLRPLRLGYSPDNFGSEASYTTSYTVASTEQKGQQNAHPWRQYPNVEKRRVEGWSPLEHNFDSLPIQWTNTYPADFHEMLVPPPNSVTPFAFHTIDPPPNTPYDL